MQNKNIHPFLKHKSFAGDCVYMLSMVKPKFIFVGPESEQLIESAILEAGLNTEMVVFGDTDNHIPFSEFLISTGNEEAFEPTPVDNVRDTAIIFFSSGTTGMPKGIMTSHYGLMAQNLYIRYIFIYFIYNLY